MREASRITGLQATVKISIGQGFMNQAENQSCGPRAPVWLLAIFLVASSIPANAQQDAPLKLEDAPARVDKLFVKWDSYSTPGCAVGVYRDGRSIYLHGYGMADLDHNARIEPSTIFHVASMSKQFTAASVIMLSLQGKLSLDDPVQKYIPELPDFGAPITLRELMHHTSGLRDQWTLLDIAGWRYSLDLITNNDVLALMARQKALNFPPGSRYMYCNTGYTLLGEVVKRVSGESLRDYTTHHIFEPLGMTHTHFRDNHAELVKNMAIGYVPKGDTFEISITNFDTVGATSLLTTVEDLQKWDENFYTPRVGGERFLQEMLRPGKLNNGELLKYASGLSVMTYRGLPIVDHTGADAGYRSDMLRFPQEHFTVSVLCNVATGDPSGQAHRVADIYLADKLKPEEVLPEPKPVQLSETWLWGHTGAYINSDNNDILKIVFAAGRLAIAAEGAEPPRPFTPLADSRFRMGSAEYDFRDGADGGGELAITRNGEKADVYSKIPAFDPTRADLGAFAGTYRSGEIDALYRFKVEDHKLVLHRLNYDPETLRMEGPDLFDSRMGVMRFTRDSPNRVTGFVLNSGRVLNFQFEKIG
jgi:CubicO group peptidase (beta-lactamase class C family)